MWPSSLRSKKPRAAGAFPAAIAERSRARSASRSRESTSLWPSRMGSSVDIGLAILASRTHLHRRLPESNRLGPRLQRVRRSRPRPLDARGLSRRYTSDADAALRLQDLVLEPAGGQ